MKFRHAIPILLLALGQSVLAASGIYKTTDKDGNVIFTDQKVGEMREVELRETTTIPAQKIPRTPPARLLDQAGNAQPARYASLNIVTPADGEAIRDNAGNLELRFDIKPAASGTHIVQLVIDGEVKMEVKGNAASLTNVDRGEHQFQLKVISRETGKLIQEGPVSKISLLRFSKLHKRPAASP